ncbi:unnamed protein product, partial [Linum tenue]
NELLIHRHRHPPKNHHARHPRNQDQCHQIRQPQVIDYHFLHLHFTHPLGDGNSCANRQVRALRREFDGSSRHLAVYHLAHSALFLFEYRGAKILIME